MMKVLWICGLPDEVRQKGWTSELSPCPTPAWSWILGHLPPPSGVELHILCPVVGLKGRRVDFSYKGAEWHCFNRKPFRHLFSYIRHIFSVKRFIRDLGPDVIHGWGGETGFGFWATAFTPRAVVSVQGLLLLLLDLSEKVKKDLRGLYGKYLIFREKLTYHRAYRLTTESDVSKVALKKYYGANGVLIPHPLRAAFYEEFTPMRMSCRPVFLFVGSLFLRKGVFDLINAFSRVENRNARLIIIGGGADKDRVEALIGKLGIGDRVELRGVCSGDEIVKEMERAHFFSLPSYGDTGPTALKEALARGLFPICYDNSGPHEYVTRYCGYLCPTGDIGALTEIMNRAVVNIDTCIAEGLKAAERIRRDLARDEVWKKLEVVYREAQA